MKRIILAVLILLGICGYIIIESCVQNQAIKSEAKSLNDNRVNNEYLKIVKASDNSSGIICKNDFSWSNISSTSAENPVIENSEEELMLHDSGKFEGPAIANAFISVQNTKNSTSSAISISETDKSPEGKVNKYTVIKLSDSEFEVYCDLGQNKTQLITFDKKAWGTWNIGNWYYSLKNSFLLDDFEQVAGGSGTDWEYVFRVGDLPNNIYDFSGGNHGKEELIDINIICDGDEKELSEIKKGEKLKASKLVICEDTALCLDDSFKDKFANVTRRYEILPNNILLDTHFEFTSDVYMGTSYICMFPISKEMGRFIKFNDSGDVYETPALGSTFTTGKFENYLGEEKTLSVQIWGDKKPNYKFSVKIDNAQMADNFVNKLKVFYWDLNKFSNKLYFSKLDSDNPQKITAGTKWDNRAQWEFEAND